MKFIHLTNIYLKVLEGFALNAIVHRMFLRKEFSKLDVWFPKCSMSGMLSCIWLIFYGKCKCREIYYTMDVMGLCSEKKSIKWTNLDPRHFAWPFQSQMMIRLANGTGEALRWFPSKTNLVACNECPEIVVFSRKKNSRSLYLASLDSSHCMALWPKKSHKLPVQNTNEP